MIEQYDLEVFTPPCDPGAERYAARAHLAVDISEVLPYLNATLRGAVYTPAANALTWKKGGHNIAFHAHEIAASNVEDRGGAEREIKGLVDLVNRTWQRRGKSRLTPALANAPRRWRFSSCCHRPTASSAATLPASPSLSSWPRHKRNWPLVHPWSSRSTLPTWPRWKLF